MIIKAIGGCVDRKRSNCKIKELMGQYLDHRKWLELYLKLVVVLLLVSSSSSLLSDDYYESICPDALPVIRRVVDEAVKKEPRMAASLLRLHFHDCFVQGCDGSILLDLSPTIDSEKFAVANNNSVRGFEVVDEIKAAVDHACGKPVVSCADILAVAARDSVVAVGGPWWKVGVGRKDSTTADRSLANKEIPSPFLDLPALIQNFANQGLDRKDLVVLSGGHTIGFAQCFTFRDRIYNDTNIHLSFAGDRRAECPRVSGEGDSNLGPLDQTPVSFDTNYFRSLTELQGLLRSDQALFSSAAFTRDLVRKYSYDFAAFSKDFGESMIKMGNIKVLTGDEGQVRVNCRVVNPC